MRPCTGFTGLGRVNLIGQVYRLAEGLVCGLTKGLYQWLAVCGIGLASIRA